MSLVSTKQAGLAGFTKYRSLDDASGNPVFYGTKGMILMKPTSITYSGTSASLGANGQVTFSAVTSLSLNGCFTADFNNYVISIEATGSTGIAINTRLRAAGSDASGSDYTRQYINASSTSISAARLTSQTEATVGFAASSVRNGSTVFIYGPALAQPTAFRCVATGGSTLFLDDEANTHSLSTAYDGCTFIPNTGNITGKLQVYGVRS